MHYYFKFFYFFALSSFLFAADENNKENISPSANSCTKVISLSNTQLSTPILILPKPNGLPQRALTEPRPTSAFSPYVSPKNKATSKHFKPLEKSDKVQELNERGKDLNKLLEFKSITKDDTYIYLMQEINNS